ncbi:MAG: FecR domain-containing protein [Alphaproteobacteria bacterium]
MMISATGLHRRLSLVVALVVLTLSIPAPGAEAQTIAGSVARLRGDAEASQGDATRRLAIGATIFVGDEIATGSNTRLELRMIDGTVVTLGDDTQLTIDEFLYNAETEEGRGVFGIATGVFRAITGAITKLREPELTVNTPVATIGIRGTDFWGDQKADRLQLALLSGGPITVENAAGRLELVAQKELTVVTSQDAPPSETVILTDEQLQAAAATVAF